VGDLESPHAALRSVKRTSDKARFPYAELETGVDIQRPNALVGGLT